MRRGGVCQGDINSQTLEASPRKPHELRVGVGHISLHIMHNFCSYWLIIGGICCNRGASVRLLGITVSGLVQIQAASRGARQLNLLDEISDLR